MWLWAVIVVSGFSQKHGTARCLHSLLKNTPPTVSMSRTSEAVETIRSFEQLTDLGGFNTHNPTNNVDSAALDQEVAPLMRDIELLSNILGEIIQRENVEVYKVLN